MPDDTVQKVIKDYEESRKFHDTFVEKVNQCYDAYRGHLDEQDDAAQWTSRLHPPVIHQIVESIAASLIEPTLKFKVTPRAKQTDPQDWDTLVSGAKTLERLLDYELDIDRFRTKIRPFVLQALITGLTAGKIYWLTQEGKKKSLQVADIHAYGDENQYLGTYSGYQERETTGTIKDDPCFEVVDVRDFFWQESATTLDNSRFIIHRQYKTYEELLGLQDAGIYNNVEELKKSKDKTPGGQTDREMKYNRTERSKDRIEILEYWTDKKYCVVGDQRVLLKEGPNPFWHGKKPFVVASANPDLFQVPGISIVELVSDLQDMLWTLMNQRIDALRLLANPILLVRHDVDDPDAWEHEPGARWAAESLDQAKFLEIPVEIPRMTIEAEGLLKGDLQGIPGGLPFATGADTQTIDQKTATGVSIITNIAQRQIEARKQNLYDGFSEVGWQITQLLQQFLRDEKAILVVGKDGSLEPLNVHPGDIQGEYDVTLEISNESLMRQERRAEAQAKMQVAAQVAPIFAAVQQPLNMKKFMEDFLEAFDAGDTESYFSVAPQPAMGPGGNGNNPGGPGGPGGPPGPGGVTAPQASSPTSPSNQTSVSPEVFMQRSLASQGGANNAG